MRFLKTHGKVRRSYTHSKNFCASLKAGTCKGIFYPFLSLPLKKANAKLENIIPPNK
jgi:hypothetical protein